MQSVLRVLQWRVPIGAPRRITDTKHKRDVDFVFSGGIIILSNDAIDHRYGRMGAVASRTHPMSPGSYPCRNWPRRRSIALRGFKTLTPEGIVGTLSPDECRVVADYLIQQMESRQRDTKVDLRAFCEGALPDYLQWKEGKSAAHWKKVVQARI